MLFSRPFSRFMSSPGRGHERSPREPDAAAAPTAHGGRAGVRVRRGHPQSRARAAPSQGASRLSDEDRGCRDTACRRLLLAAVPLTNTASPPRCLSGHDVHSWRHFFPTQSVWAKRRHIGKGTIHLSRHLRCGESPRNLPYCVLAEVTSGDVRHHRCGIT